jgi:hypothetical protein
MVDTLGGGWGATFGNLLKKLPNPISKSPTILNCHLTYLNVKWDIIIKDMLLAAKKQLNSG